MAEDTELICRPNNSCTINHAVKIVIIKEDKIPYKTRTEKRSRYDKYCRS